MATKFIHFEWIICHTHKGKYSCSNIWLMALYCPVVFFIIWIKGTNVKWRHAHYTTLKACSFFIMVDHWNFQELLYMDGIFKISIILKFSDFVVRFLLSAGGPFEKLSDCLPLNKKYRDFRTTIIYRPVKIVLWFLQNSFNHSAVYILFWSFEISDNILRNQK